MLFSNVLNLNLSVQEVLRFLNSMDHTTDEEAEWLAALNAAICEAGGNDAEADDDADAVEFVDGDGHQDWICVIENANRANLCFLCASCCVSQTLLLGPECFFFLRRYIYWCSSACHWCDW